ncbi:IS66 family transposase [Paracoccus actinidiae]|uniref:IS66 family transposase n=1 Tax=Paracoccus actinidiae TaxID=3064531 RepID=UPI0027D205F5|nr:transposase [Paracoccus sp. M09]
MYLARSVRRRGPYTRSKSHPRLTGRPRSTLRGHLRATHLVHKELSQVLARSHRRKHKLLKVLERPEIPLHTNASENDLRACVTKRRSSGGTMSADGRQARDVMLGLMKTCRKLGISFFAYLGDRLGVKGLTGCIPFLPELVAVRPA